MASPWSAPGWMKTTGSMIKGTLRHDAYDAYAEYFRRFIDAYAAEGVPIFAITVQNEPHFEPDDYPGMRLDPPQRARFVRHIWVPRIKTRILEWDHNWDRPQFAAGGPGRFGCPALRVGRRLALLRRRRLGAERRARRVSDQGRLHHRMLGWRLGAEVRRQSRVDGEDI